MKLLLDQNISYQIIKKIEKYYEEVVQTGRLGMAQTSDAMLWQYARVNDYVIVTIDEYFQNRTLLMGHPPKVITLKGPQKNTEHLAQLLKNHRHVIKDFVENPNLSCLELSE